MIVSKSQVQNAIMAYVHQVQRREKPAGQANKPPAGNEYIDRVQLSETAREIEKLKEALKHLPEVREEKVATLKKAVKEGTYNIEGKQVAEKILERSLADKLGTVI